ncbi:hypothetical protein [Nostoc sp.]
MTPRRNAIARLRSRRGLESNPDVQHIQQQFRAFAQKQAVMAFTYS